MGVCARGRGESACLLVPDWKDLSAGGVLAFLIIREVFAFLSKKRHTNGNGAHKASVKPEDAPEFYLLQRSILQKLEIIEDELLDPQVKRHHRERR